ncbi:MAG: FHA domain-containing protein, partial [Myxococcales bacterium]|nr:FHA domain-containing protein [Myxococcales bacterium]
MGDQNRKTLRSFYCRDYLWELYEVMTQDLGCSMDYLINEAMRHYARSRNYSLAASNRQGEPQVVSPFGPPGTPQPAAAPEQRRPPPLPGQPHAPGHQPPPSPQPPLPGQVAAGSAPAATPVAPAAAPAAAAQRQPLFLLFNGQRYRIDKDKFVIGRGSQMTDLTIRDGNISRKHAA